MPFPLTLLGLWLVLMGCAPEPLTIQVESIDRSGVVVRADPPMVHVELRDARGGLVVSRSPDPPADVVTLRAPLRPGSFTVQARSAAEVVSASATLADSGPMSVWVEAPLGQSRQAASSDEPVKVPVPTASSVRVGVGVDVHAGGSLEWVAKVDGSPVMGPERVSVVPGERRVIPVQLSDSVMEVVFRLSGRERRVRLVPQELSLAEARDQLQIEGVFYPALPDGSIDRTLPSGRIVLAAVWWEQVLDRLRLGFRPRDDQAPRTHLAVQLRNTSDASINVVVASRSDHPAFRPRLRDATDLDTVRRLVRVPAGQAIDATLPIYVDRSSIPASGVFQHPLEIEVTPLGSDAVLHTRTVSLVVERGTPWASALLVLGCGSALLGWIGVIWGLRRWLSVSTGQLTTIAVFGSLSFTVGAASQLVGLGLSSVLGPFAPFVLGLADDALRMCLVGALLALVPRVGTFALATLVGWLMRALALGAVHPVDLIYLGSAIGWTESMLWMAGVTRGESHWLEGRVAWLRLSVGLAVPNAVGTAMGLAISVVLYRLYYADWYLVATVALPGLVYAAVGCAFAVPFARSLRRVG